ncbi:hypothetical protein M9458_023870, partial [Cirrhinus mrigala]
MKAHVLVRKETVEQRRGHVGSVPHPLLALPSHRCASHRKTNALLCCEWLDLTFGVSEDVIIEDVAVEDVADYYMSLAASDAEDWGAPPPSHSVRPKPDAELIHVLSKAVEDLGLDWSAPEEPAHGLLDEWYLPGSCQQSSRQHPVPFLPAVHDELTKTWRTPYSARVNPSTAAALSPLSL